MKKQLLIAAVAATMGTAAMADISITGNMKANYTNTDTNGAVLNQVNHEANLVLAGKNGDTSVHVEMALDNNTNNNTAQGTVVLEDVHLTTKIADVTLKTGAWNGTDTLLDNDSDRTSGNYIVSTTVSDVAISVEGDTQEASTSVKLAGSVAGVDLSYASKATQDEVTVGTTISGITVNYHGIDADGANEDKSSLTVSGSVAGFDLTYVQADADDSATIDGDSLLGNTAAMNVEADGEGMGQGDDISGIIVSTPLAGNTLKFVRASVDNFNPTDGDLDVTKFVLTRPLANGTTFELTYTDQDSDAAANDEEQLDLELSVKF